MSVSSFLRWGSSEVDWCEKNFEITLFIAEFWNTVSNVFFLILPPVLIYLFQPYGRKVTSGVHLVWILLILVGVGSVYFHMTLSLLGQLVDEIAIIWVVITALSIWTPKRSIPSFCNENRNIFHVVMLTCAIIFTCLAFVRPEVNCMVLFILGVPTTGVLVREMKTCKSKRVFNLGMRCCIMWMIALVSWISDRFLCSLWESIHFPYLHCSWHIFVALASYQGCVVMAYFSAMSEVPHLLPILKYWPSESFGLLGIPYVTFQISDTDYYEKAC